MTKSTLEIVGQLPAGAYYVGDPCYLFSHDEYGEMRWRAFCAALAAVEGDATHGVMLEFEGHKVFVSSTNTGDGIYTDNRGGMYSVDAGMIGAVPEALLGRHGFRGLTHRTQFAQDFKCGADVGRWRQDKNGRSIAKRIRIGHITIKT